MGCAMLLGVAKSGIKGLAVLIVTGLALVYGAKESTGILMPMLIYGDIMAVIYYKRHVKWIYLIKLLPWMILGVLTGVVLGKDLPEDLFKSGMAFIILISVIMMYYWERQKGSHSLEFCGINGNDGWFYYHGREFGRSFFQHLFFSHQITQK
jgi:uncharacterized membrane protein YfcA